MIGGLEGFFCFALKTLIMNTYGLDTFGWGKLSRFISVWFQGSF